MNMEVKQRQIMTALLGVLCAVAMVLLVYYVRQRLFTQAEPIVLAP
jgi:hypothetical protein